MLLGVVGRISYPQSRFGSNKESFINEHRTIDRTGNFPIMLRGKLAGEPITEGDFKMASLRTRTRGGSLMYEIDFYANCQRKTITLGKKYTQRTANELKGIVETLLRYNDNGMTVLDKRTETWIETATPEIREKLAKTGLIELPPSHTAKELWDMFLAQKSRNVKESTVTIYEASRKRFFRFFREAEDLESFTKERIQQWKDSLFTSGNLAEATIASTLKDVKAVFNWAITQGWIEKSPLDGIGRGSFVNRKKDRSVTMEEYCRLMDACPCQDWRVIIALTRIGGLRCPSEVLQLRWEDVNWEYNKFYVRSSKTEHHKGKEGRWVPLFPELKLEFETLFFSPTSECREFVINRYREATQNLRTTFGKIVKRAGLEMLPRPFDNMRMTRSNEVYREWGAFKESEWIGHSSRVRADHYLLITDDDFQEASGWTNQTDTVRKPTTESDRKKILPAFFPAVREGIGLQGQECVPMTDQR